MMEVGHPEALPLRRTWEEFRETIVDPSADVLQNSARPEHFFVNLGDSHRGLNWFANIFIAIGLLITFLGIIAALSTLDFSGGVDAMQERLNELMKVAGAKFWASRSEEHTSELQSLMRISYAVFCLKKKTNIPTHT